MILGLVQARFSSTRLPGKVLKQILGKPMLLLQLERIKRSQKIDRLIVVTSTAPSDIPILESCRNAGYEVFTGSLDDVLDRFYQCAKSIGYDHIVRLTGDCPLADPGVIDDAIEFTLTGDFEYASNSVKPSFPDGLDVEVMTFPALEKAWREAKLRSEREHVTPYLYKDFSTAPRFRVGFFKNSKDYSHLRWTVDEQPDFELVKRIFEALYPSNPDFRLTDILAFLEKNPELSTLNAHFKRNEGLKKSIQNDGVTG